MKAVIQTRGLTKTYAQGEAAMRALDDVTLDLHAASRRDFGERMCDPRWFVAFSPVGNGCEIRRIRLYEQAILRNQTNQVVVRPFLERDDTAERNVPSRVQGELCQ